MYANDSTILTTLDPTACDTKITNNSYLSNYRKVYECPTQAFLDPIACDTNVTTVTDHHIETNWCDFCCVSYNCEVDIAIPSPIQDTVHFTSVDNKVTTNSLLSNTMEVHKSTS